MIYHHKLHRVFRNKGLTLIEALVVVGVLALLAGLLLPAVLGAREQARRARCSSNLREVTLACHAFATIRGGFPGDGNGTAIRGLQNPAPLSAHAMLLPYLESPATFNAINGQVPLKDSIGPVGRNLTAASQSIQTFTCPSDPMGVGCRLGPNTYRVNVGFFRVRTIREVGLQRRIEVDHNGAFEPFRVVRFGEFKDGTS